MAIVSRVRKHRTRCWSGAAVAGAGDAAADVDVDARESGGKLVGKCLVPLQPLLSTCELTVSTPILTEGRREAGGSVEMSLRLRKPISSDEVVVTEVIFFFFRSSHVFSVFAGAPCHAGHLARTSEPWSGHTEGSFLSLRPPIPTPLRHFG